jgi:hypothetical protein
MSLQEFFGYARKFLIALAAALAILATAVSDNTVSVSEWIAIAVGFIGALGVYAVKNDQVK